MSESQMDLRIAHARMRADLMEKHLAGGNPLERVDVEALVNSLREMLGYLGEAGPPLDMEVLGVPHPAFNPAQPTGMPRIRTDAAGRLRAVRGVVPAPPPEGPWIVRPWISDPEEAKKRLGKNSLSSMLGWWRVFRGGMHTGAPQPSGAFETEAEAVAVRDALNRLADGVRAVPAPPLEPTIPTPEELSGKPAVEHASVVFEVAPGDRCVMRSEARGGCGFYVIRYVRRMEYAWLEYQTFPLSDEPEGLCDACGESYPRRVVRARHLCFKCYENAPVRAVPAPQEGPQEPQEKP